MLRILFVLVATSTVAVVCQAQEPKALVNEMVIHGTIESVDVVNNRLTLTITGFTAASGIVKALEQPRFRTVQILDSTKFVESSGIKNPSLGDLGKGFAVRILIKDLGTDKPFAARYLSWTSPRPPLPLDPLTPPAVAPFLPPPQESKGIGLRVVDAGFAPLRELLPLSHLEMRPTFHFGYRLTLPDLEGLNKSDTPRDINQFVTLRRAYGPDGQVLRSMGGIELDRKDPRAQGLRVTLDEVDPSWPSITAEFEILDPQAPPSARGVVKSKLTFENLPVPGAVGKKMEVNRTLKTALGTEITLLDVEGEQTVGINRKATTTHITFKASETNPDLALQLMIDKVVSDGVEWEAYSKATDTSKPLLMSRIDTLGPAGAKKMAITYDVTERAPSLQERQWYSLVRVEVPVAPLLAATMPKIPAYESSGLTYASAATPDVRVEAEFNDRSMLNTWGGLLWVQGLKLAANQNWYVREVWGTDEKGEKLDTSPDSPPMMRISNLHWRADGRLAGPSEYMEPLVVSGKTMPQAVNLRVKLEKAKRLDHWSWFKGLPVPVVGTTLDLPPGRFKDEILKVKRVVTFKKLSDLPGLSDRSGPGGLAVVLEASPSFADAQLSVQPATATDDTGRDLSYGDYVAYDGDKTRAAGESSRLRTVILPPLSPGVRSFEMRFLTTETTWSGETQEVELKRVEVE